MGGSFTQGSGQMRKNRREIAGCFLLSARRRSRLHRGRSGTANRAGPFSLPRSLCYDLRMEQAYWSAKARSLQPYTAGEQPQTKLIKLNTNENAYGPSPAVGEAVAQAAPDLQLYPPTDGGAFRTAAARLHGLAPEEIFCSNGSDEALALAFLALFDPDVPVRTLDVTYSFYPVWADLHGLTLAPAALAEDFTAAPEIFRGAKSVVLANPNAPTGIELEPRLLREIIESTDGPVIVDEAYADFGAESAIPWIHEYDNLLVVRTLSKSYSLAGIRAGYAAGQPHLIRALETVRDSFNSYPVDRLAIAGAAAALDDQAWHEECCRRIVRTRERTRARLLELGHEVLPSKTNFLFVRCTQPDAQTVFQELRRRGILVRYFGSGRTQDYLRVTIGTDADMDAFLSAMEEIA